MEKRRKHLGQSIAGTEMWKSRLAPPQGWRGPGGVGTRAFILCRPQVPSKIDCVMFFGPVVPDGYGVCYNPMEAHINFSVSAYNSCAETNAARLTHYLEKALLDMRALLQSHPRAKL